MIKLLSACSIMLVFALGPAYAEKAHTHGHGTLNIAIEGDTIEMEFEVPGADIIGFEYAARTKADKDKLKAAKAVLNAPSKLFTLSSGAVCNPVHTDVHYTREEHADTHEGHQNHDANHEGHESHDANHEGHESHVANHEGHENHDLNHSDAHKNAHKHQDKSGKHGEFHAHYKFTCANPTALSAIRFGYFRKFSRATKLKVNIVTPKKQKQYDVTPELGAIDLTDLI